MSKKASQFYLETVFRIQNLSVSRKSARGRYQEGKLFSQKFVLSINKTI